MRALTRMSVAVGAVLALAACGTTDPAADASAADGPGADAQTNDMEADADSEPDAAADGNGNAQQDADDDADRPVLAVASTSLGEILVDGGGMTLYMFDPDEQGPSTCEDDCLQAWPPLMGEPVDGEGIDVGLLGTSERSDGSDQATYDGWPLYHWVGDDQPGDVNGQGVQDVWWVLTSDGTVVRDADLDDAATTDSSY